MLKVTINYANRDTLFANCVRILLPYATENHLRKTRNDTFSL